MNSLTIITICYNSARTIGRTIDSILRQPLPPQQYVIVDGGSTDGTLDLLDSRRKDIEKAGICFELVRQDDHPGMAGIPHAWNLGIGQSFGDVIGLLNSDDWYEQDTLCKVMTMFDLYPDIQATASPITLRDSSGRPCGRLRIKPLFLLPLLMPIPHPSLFVKRSVYEQIGTYDPRYRISADYDFIWRCRLSRIKWRFFSSPLTNMEVGGRANSNRDIAREETYAIGRKYAPFSLLPLLGRFLREKLGR